MPDLQPRVVRTYLCQTDIALWTTNRKRFCALLTLHQCPIHTGTPDTDRTVSSCPVWRCELSRPDRPAPTGAFSVGVCRAAQAGTAGATAGRTPTQNALVGGRLGSHRLTRHRQDRLVLSGGRCELCIITQHSPLASDRPVDRPVGLQSTTVYLSDSRYTINSAPQHALCAHAHYTRCSTSAGQLLRSWLVAWHSGRTSVSDWRTFPVLRSTCS